MNEMNNLFIPFTKSDDEERMVYGYASTEALDSQGEIVLKDAITEALPEYMKFGNIREMHQPSAVGKAQEATIDEKGLFIGVKVVDDTAWQKVKEGVYNGFSIGGKIITKISDTITKLRLTEISLVDRPANPEAIFAFYKGEDMEEEIKPEITETNPVEEVNKADNNLDILKGFMGEEIWDVSTALSALDAVMYLLSNEQNEMDNNEEQITALTAAIKAIKAFIVSEIQEDNGSGESESNEVDVIELSEKTEDISKAGASISRANKDKLASIMAMCKELMGDDTEKDDGGDDDSEKSESNEDLAKGADLQKSFDILKGELDIAKSDLEKANKRIKDLEDMPEAPKGSLLTIGKSDDVSEQTISKSVVYDSNGNVNEIASDIKAIHKGQ